MKTTQKSVLSKEQLGKVAKEFGLTVKGTMTEPKFKSKNSKNWVEFDPVSGQYKISFWKYWATGGIAAVIATAITENYPHPDVVRSIEAKIGRLL